MLITACIATFGATFLATLAVLWPKTQRETLRPLRKAYFAPLTLMGRPVRPVMDEEPVNTPMYEDGVLVGYKRP